MLAYLSTSLAPRPVLTLLLHPPPPLQAGPVVVLVPVPDNTASAKLLVTAGRAKYDATKKALVWKVGRGRRGVDG